MREPYYPYTTPESKRELAAQYRRDREKFGTVIGDPDPAFWEALATLQEQGRIGEWKALYQRWESAKPHPRDLLP